MAVFASQAREFPGKTGRDRERAGSERILQFLRYAMGTTPESSAVGAPPSFRGEGAAPTCRSRVDPRRRRPRAEGSQVPATAGCPLAVPYQAIV